MHKEIVFPTDEPHIAVVFTGGAAGKQPSGKSLHETKHGPSAVGIAKSCSSPSSHSISCADAPELAQDCQAPVLQNVHNGVS